MNRKLTAYYSNADLEKYPCPPDSDQIFFEEVVRIAKSKEFLRWIWKYDDVCFCVPTLNAFPRPFLTAAIFRLMARRSCTYIAGGTDQVKIGLGKMLSEFWQFLYEKLTYKNALKRIEQEIAELENAPVEHYPLREDATPVFLRCDYSYGYIAGGSIGHIAGVLNHLGDSFGQLPLFLTTDKIPTVREDIPYVLLRGNAPYRNVRDIASLFFSNTVYEMAKTALADKKISMIYQRSALNAYAGVKLARELRVPFVLEYNGSEVWASKHWGGRELNAMALSEKIERVTFRHADLIVCVSQPLKDELMGIGVPAERILVNPNGVNEKRYYPEIDGSPIRGRYGIGGSETVIGFIGTFGAWHGAEVLAQVFASLSREAADDAVPVKLLLMGDGIRMNAVKEILTRANVMDRCVLTGMIPQEEGASHLAACDILVSPQVPNPDGTPFFGSPTKLFEYMAMGKAIAASDLDQIGEVLEDGRTAILCKPGDEESLLIALRRLAADGELRAVLGANARQEAVEKYTWSEHVKRTIDHLKALQK